MPATISFNLPEDLQEAFEKKAKSFHLDLNSYMKILVRAALDLPIPNSNGELNNLHQRIGALLGESLPISVTPRGKFLEECFNQHQKLNGNFPYQAYAQDVARYKYDLRDMTQEEIKQYIALKLEGNGKETEKPNTAGT